MSYKCRVCGTNDVAAEGGICELCIIAQSMQLNNNDVKKASEKKHDAAANTESAPAQGFDFNAAGGTAYGFGVNTASGTTQSFESGKESDSTESGGKLKIIIPAVIGVAVIAAVFIAFIYPRYIKPKTDYEDYAYYDYDDGYDVGFDDFDDGFDDFDDFDDGYDDGGYEDFEDITETTTEEATEAIPEALKKYSDRLVEENKWYVVKLSQDDWKIKIRSTPEYFAGKVTNDNTVGLIQSGTEIYVEYICDGTWAVYQKDGEYVFSSLYDVNDETRKQLIVPKD